MLAAQPSSFLSHTSAAAELQVCREGPRVHVIAPRRTPRRLEGVLVHRPRHLDPADLTRCNGLPITTLPRTLLDLAEILPYDRLRSVAEEAERLELLDLDALTATMTRNPGRRGLKPLSALISHHRALPITHEGIEREFQVLVREEGLPLPQVNVLLAGQRVDCYWPEARFVVELDSRGFHSNWAARERDMVRDANLLRIGIATLRVTHRRMREERSELVADLRVHTGRGPLLR